MVLINLVISDSTRTKINRCSGSNFTCMLLSDKTPKYQNLFIDIMCTYSLFMLGFKIWFSGKGLLDFFCDNQKNGIIRSTRGTRPLQFKKNHFRYVGNNLKDYYTILQKRSQHYSLIYLWTKAKQYTQFGSLAR
jgi:hypothetical protein